MKQLLILACFLYSTSIISQEIKSPSEFLGYELGTQFTRHHEVVDYYEYLAEVASDRVQVTSYGKTNERRPLLMAYISSASNMKNLENKELLFYQLNPQSLSEIITLFFLLEFFLFQASIPILPLLSTLHLLELQGFGQTEI